ncbi:MAG: efflux RND transporter permease subunit [Phycisphaerae bacterium]
MTSLPRFSVDNPVLVNLFMFAIIVAGLYSGLTLTREVFPESRPSLIAVTTSYPGATPAEVEKGITRKIEEQIKDVDGVDKIKSSIGEGSSRIMVELRSGFDAVDRAVDDIKAAVDAIPSDDFPEDALETRVAKFELRAPVISVVVFGDLDDRTLKTLAERLRDDVLAIPGITSVSLFGTRKDEISVDIRPEKLIEYGVSFMDVADAIAESNLDLPGGQIKTTAANVAVRTLGEEDLGDALYDIIVRGDATGRVVRVRDVATIVDGFEDAEISGRFLAAPSAGVTVYKTADQDAIQIADAVRALVAGKTRAPLERPWFDRLRYSLAGRDPVMDIYRTAAADPYPTGARVQAYADLSKFIAGRLDLLQRNGLWGLVLVFLSLLMFLHWRVAFWVMMGLVLAVAGALVVMHALGQTLNLISAFGLIVVLGLLVDDAIIVAEHVYARVEAGAEPRLAAVEGAEAVTWPVVCTIATTIVAFAPLTQIEGRIGDWIGVLPVIVCVALTVSLFEALTILPSHLAHGLASVRIRRPHAPPDGAASASPPEGRRPAVPEAGGAGGSADARRDRPTRYGAIAGVAAAVRRARTLLFRGGLVVGYERVLRAAAAYRYVTMACLVALLVAAGGLVAGGHVPRMFLQQMDSETIVANLKMPIGTPAAGTEAAVRAVERAAMKLPEVETVYSITGLQLDDFGAPLAQLAHVGQVYLDLSPADQRDRSSDDIINELRTETAAIPRVERLRFNGIQGGPGGMPIHLEISGDRIDDLIAVADRFKRRLADFEGVSDITDDFDAGRPEVRVELLDSARALGLTTQSLATQVRAAFYGFEARKVQRGREDVKIMVRYPPDRRRHIYDLESMYVAASPGTLVPLAEVARLSAGTGYATIKRTDQRRTVTVLADVDDKVTNTDSVLAKLADDFPDVLRAHPGVRLAFGGQKLENAKAFGSLKQGFVAVLLLIYVILAGLFRSYVQPVIVMVAIPFGLIGVVAGHFVLGYPLTIVSMIGVVALTGIVVNDSMILITFINRRVADGAPVFDAVIQGGKGRLRPILLTSLTTVLGLAPLLMETSFQAKFLIPMGVSISGGLIFSTVLTLVGVPALYLIVEDARAGMAHIKMLLVSRPHATTTPR